MNCQECATELTENANCFCESCFKSLENRLYDLEHDLEDANEECDSLSVRYTNLEDDFNAARNHIEHLEQVIKKANLKLKTMDQHLQIHGIHNQLTLLEEDEPW